MTEKAKKTCLVISYGPVPTTEYRTVEGGGMRAWGLATGLAKHDIDVTVAINAAFPQKLSKHDGIHLTNWAKDQKSIDLINSYDAVVVSYCMGDDSLFIADNIAADIQLILDVYVPIYVEVSARDSKDITTEYKNYMADIKRFNRVLKRGDYFICASDSQKIFYTGVLGALGIVNPRSYRQDRILIVPFGIPSLPAKAANNPYKDLGIGDSDFVVLWFGGLYPWFRVEELMEAINSFAGDKHVKFTIVGGKNPFNSNLDFVRQYEKVHDFAIKHKLIDTSLYFVDWVDYDDRVNWYQHANVVISLNQPGDENIFAWRTRVMDYVWGELPIITNGGDPLSEQLISADAALRLPELSSTAIRETLHLVIKNPSRLSTLKDNVKKLRPGFYWETIVLPMSQLIEQASKPYNDEREFARKVKAESTTENTGRFVKVKRAISYAQRKGVRKTLQMTKNYASMRVNNALNRPRQFYFISHPVDNTGAPLILLQMLDEFAKKYGAPNVHLVSPHTDPHHLRALREKGIQVVYAGKDTDVTTIRIQMNLRGSDFVLMNTLGVPENYREFIFHNLENGSLKKAYWFIHEDKAQTPFVCKDFLSDDWLKRTGSLVSDNKLKILVPSERIRHDYNRILKTEKVKTIPYRVNIPAKFTARRIAQDYSKIDFVLSGTPTDGRKGQLIAIAAFYEFIKNYYNLNPSAYRDFRLHLIAVGNDYVSEQIQIIGNSFLGKRLKLYPSMHRDKALQILRSCNAVICCSLNETFAIYVAEGMMMGHVVLRNNSAGVDEQLQEGVNGYAIDSSDVHQFAAVIEKILNKKTSSDEDLKKMGEASQRLIKPYASHTYVDKLD